MLRNTLAGSKIVASMWQTRAEQDWYCSTGDAKTLSRATRDAKTVLSPLLCHKFSSLLLSKRLRGASPYASSLIFEPSDWRAVRMRHIMFTIIVNYSHIPWHDVSSICETEKRVQAMRRLGGMVQSG